MLDYFGKEQIEKGAIFGTLGGFATLLLTSLVWKNPLGVTPLLWSLIVNCILLVGISLVTAKPPKEVTDKFFEAV